MGDVIRLRRTYEAKSAEVASGTTTFRLSGTLDGFIDVAAIHADGGGVTYPFSLDEARLLIAALHAVTSDVAANCLHERDALLIT